MAINVTDTQKSIGIIGGGNVGCQLLTLFNSSQQTRVVFVMDINPSAPAMELARKNLIKTFTDMDQALNEQTDFLLEVTGNVKVVETIKRRITGTPVILISHAMASLIINTLEESNQRTRQKVVQEISVIGAQIDQSLGVIRDLVTSIDDITAEMNILAINARIEAARVGQAGASFAVVASAMGESAEKVKEITGQIGQVNETIEDTSQKITVSLAALQ